MRWSINSLQIPINKVMTSTSNNLRVNLVLQEGPEKLFIRNCYKAFAKLNRYWALTGSHIAMRTGLHCPLSFIQFNNSITLSQGLSEDELIFKADYTWRCKLWTWWQAHGKILIVNVLRFASGNAKNGDMICWNFLKINYQRFIQLLSLQFFFNFYL